jgi:hypothetical protein
MIDASHAPIHLMFALIAHLVELIERTGDSVCRNVPLDMNLIRILQETISAK